MKKKKSRFRAGFALREWVEVDVPAEVDTADKALAWARANKLGVLNREIGLNLEVIDHYADVAAIHDLKALDAVSAL